MAVHIVNDPLAMGAANLVADRELYTDSEQERLLEVGDADAAFLVAAGPGSPIDGAMAEKLGLELDGKGIVKQRKPGKDKELHDGLDKDATPPEDDGTEGEAIVAPGADELKELTVAQLKDIAKEHGVPGFGSMNKAELVAAIAEGGEMASGSGDD